jgi:hypothetical protein
VKPGWVAGAVRARLLANRRLGRDGVREVAAADSLADGMGFVVASPYGRDVTAGMVLADAQHAVRATALWHLRVLAGWLPPGASDLIRVLAAGFEIANVEAHLDELAGGPAATPFELGALSTVWPRARPTRSIGELRAVLAASPWGDPGTDERGALAAALRLVWARRVADAVPELRRWATAGAAVVVAGERFGHDRELSPPAGLETRRVLGLGWTAPTLEEFVAALPTECRGAFADVAHAADVWRAEAAWWRGFGDEAARESRRAATGRAAVAWSAVLLLVDAHDVTAGLEAAQWGPAGLETFDALA